MSVNIVLPDLPNWVQQRINTLYGAKTTEEFDDAFDAFIAKEVTIKVNGKSTSRDEYKKMVQGEITTDVGAQVTFNGIVSVPSESKNLRAIGTGTVGAFFDAVVFRGRFFVFGARQSSTVSSSMNVVVIQDPTLHRHQVGRGGAFDARRVTNLNEVFTDTQNKIVPPFIPAPSSPSAPSASSDSRRFSIRDLLESKPLGAKPPRSARKGQAGSSKPADLGQKKRFFGWIKTFAKKSEHDRFPDVSTSPPK